MPNWLLVTIATMVIVVVIEVVKFFFSPLKTTQNKLFTKREAKKARRKVEKTLRKDMEDIDRIVKTGKSRAEAVLAKIKIKGGKK